MQKLESNYERRKKEIQELIEKELKIYISELNKFVGIMKSEEDWANKFDTPKWILSVKEQIATVEKEYSACICLKENEKETMKNKIFKEFENEDFAYRYSVLKMLEIFGLN